MLRFIAIYGLMVLANLTFLACEQESEETFPDNRAVVFAPLHSVWGGGAQSRAFDTDWEDGDQVGIYMINNGAQNLTDAIYTNKLYTIDATGALVPDGTPMKYPVDGNEYNFVAYYPWKDSSEIPSNIYSVDVSTQEPLKNIDLMIGVSKAPPYSLNAGKVVELEFEHKLSKLVITAEPAASTVIDMTDATLTITGMPTTVTCDLKNGALAAALGTGNIEAWRENKEDSDKAEKAVWKALIIPHKAVNYTGCIFTIEAGGEIYKYPLTAADDFDPGNVYTYTFTLTTE